MVKWSKIWEKKFNKPMLNDQDWLEPSDGTFDQILQGIDKPNRRKWIFWIPLLSLFVLIPLTLFIFKSYSSQIHLNKDQLANSAQGGIASNDLESTNGQYSNGLLQIVENAHEKIESISSTKPVNPRSEIDLIKSEILPLVGKQNSGLVSTPVHNSSHSSDAVEPDETLLLSKSSSLNRSVLDIVQLNNDLLFLPNEEIDFGISPTLFKVQDRLIPVAGSKKRYFQIFGGVNKGIHVLNSNYEFALAPADFYAEDKLGYQLGIGVNQQIGKRVGVTFNVSYKLQNYTSGHNSEVIYNTAKEDMDHSQTYELTLATPFGFVQSDFVLSRSTAYDEPATVLDAIFGSSHEIHAIGTDVILDYAIVKQDDWSISITGGASLTYALKIENRLASLNTQHEFIQYEGGTIEKDQSGIFKFNPALLGGVMLKRNLGQGQLVFNAHYNHSARAFFRQQEFSSQLHSLNMDIGYQFRF